MPIYHEVVDRMNVSKEELEVVLPPREFGDKPRRVLTFTNYGDLPLADATIQVGPTPTGPWFDEDLTGNPLPTLAAEASAVYRMDKVDRYLQVQAQGGAGEEGASHLQIWIDAYGP
jgi:hypothetical protein